MADAWDQFPDAPAALAAKPTAGADPWAAFADAPTQRFGSGKSVPEEPGAGPGMETLKAVGSDALDAILGPIQLAVSGASKAVMKPLSGVAGLATEALTGDNDAATAVVQGVQGAAAEPGQAAQRLVGEVSRAAKPVTDLTQPAARGIEQLVGKGGPVAETVVPALGEAALDLAPVAAAIKPAIAAGRSMAAGAEAATSTAARQTVAAVPDAIDRLQKAGLKFRPSDVEGAGGQGVKGAVRESLSSENTAREMALHNANSVTKLAADDLGLRGATRLTDTEFNRAKAPNFAVYEKVEQAVKGTPPTEAFADATQKAVALVKGETPKTTTKIIGQLRRQSTNHMRTQEPAAEALAMQERAAADALEDALGGQLGQMGKTGEALLGDYRTARMKLAKIHNVEDATRAGNVDAAVMFKLQNKGVPLSGNLETIALAGEHLPKIVRHPTKLSTPGRTVSHVPLLKPAVEIGKRVVEKIPGINIGSERFQRGLTAPRGMSLEEARGIIPQNTTPLPGGVVTAEDLRRALLPLRTPKQGNLELLGDMILTPPPGRP